MTARVGQVLGHVFGREETDLNQAIRPLVGGGSLVVMGLLVHQVALSAFATVACAVCVLNTSSIILAPLATLGFAFFGTLTAIGVYLGIPVLRMVYNVQSNNEDFITAQITGFLNFELSEAVTGFIPWVLPSFTVPEDAGDEQAAALLEETREAERGMEETVFVVNEGE